MGAAERSATTYRHQAVLSRAEGDERSAGRKETLAAYQAGRGEQLGVIHEARELWRADTALHAEAAEASRAELARRDPEYVPAPVEEVDLRRPPTTQVDMEQAVEGAHASTERIPETRADLEVQERETQAAGAWRWPLRGAAFVAVGVVPGGRDGVAGDVRYPPPCEDGT